MHLGIGPHRLLQLLSRGAVQTSGGSRTTCSAELTVKQGQDWMARRDLLMSYQAVGHWLKFNL